jgi:predicted permease
LTDVTACVSFYLLIWSPLFWTCGKFILGLNDEDSNSADNEGGIVTKVANLVKSVLSPSVIGSLLGIILGSSSILRDLFLVPGAHLAPVFGSLKTFGVAYLPAAILVLAGSLVKKDTGNTNEGDSSTSVHPKTVIALCFSRFILSPAIALTSVRLLSFAKLMPVDNARTIAIVTFTLLMEGCMPPAQNSVIMLQLAREKGRAAKMAKLLTVMYALSAIPVTLLLSGCLGMSGILNFE